MLDDEEGREMEDCSCELKFENGTGYLPGHAGQLMVK
jgi:hypothetical protein